MSLGLNNIVKLAMKINRLSLSSRNVLPLMKVQYLSNCCHQSTYSNDQGVSSLRSTINHTAHSVTGYKHKSIPRQHKRYSSNGAKNGDGRTDATVSTDGDITEQIRSILEEKIRPLVQEDGGDIEFVEYANNIVRVRLQGACTTCPSSTVTLQSGVKNMLQYYVPEVEDVEQVLE